MLVITRKDRQSIKIGPDILVTVWRTDEGRIRVGIDAPRDLAIHRAESSAKPHAKEEATSG